MTIDERLHTCIRGSTGSKSKSKLSRKRKCDDIPPSDKNVEKQDRRVELGWQDYDEGTQEYKQIRSQNGGGTRQLRVPKTHRVKEMLDTAKQLFFPQGKSKKGRLVMGLQGGHSIIFPVGRCTEERCP